MPAIYGLIWTTPRYVLDTGLIGSQTKFFKDRTFDQLFQLMIKDQNIPVKLNYDVIAIDQHCSNHYEKKCSFKLFATNGQEDEFDFLIWAGLPSDLPRILTKHSPSKEDLTELFDSIKHHYSTTSIVEMSNVDKAASFQVFLQQFENDQGFNNVPMLDFDTFAASRLISNDDYSGQTFSYADGSSDKYTFSVFQYCDCDQELEETKDILINHYQDFNAADIEILHTWNVPYAPRFSMEDTAKGYHWDMYEKQGENNLWVLGGAFSFESTHNVVGYNQLLLQNMN